MHTNPAHAEAISDLASGNVLSSRARPARFSNVSAILLHNTLTVMPIYRCYFLDGGDHIRDVAELETDTLDTAVDKALALLRTRPEQDAIEIWQGAERLYAARRELS